MAEIPIDEGLEEVVAMCGFDERRVRYFNIAGNRCHYLWARQRAVDDLPPYYFVPVDQLTRLRFAETQDPLVAKFRKAHPGSRAFFVGESTGAKTYEEVVFELLALHRVHAYYEQRFADEVKLLADFELQPEPEPTSEYEDLGGGRISVDELLRPRGMPALTVVLAPGGYGKTSFARKLAVTLSSKANAKNLTEYPFPVFVEFTRSAAAPGFSELLYRFGVDSELDKNRLGGLTWLIRRGKAIFVVDGFDELVGTFGLEAGRDTLREVLREVCQERGGAVLTTREHFLRFFAEDVALPETGERGVVEQHVRLIAPDVHEVVRRRLRTRDLTAEQNQQLDEVLGHLGELGDSPLVGTWISAAFEPRRRRDTGLDLSQIRSATDFYAWYVTENCRRELEKPAAFVTARGEPTRLTVEEQECWLEHLAALLLSMDNYVLATDELQDLVDYLTLALDDALDRDIDLAEGGHERLLQHTLFESVDPRELRELEVGTKVLRFRHTSLRDYLLARHFARTATPLEFGELDRPPADFALFAAELFVTGEITPHHLSLLCDARPRPALWRATIGLSMLRSGVLAGATATERRAMLDRICRLQLHDLDLTGWHINQVDLRGVDFRNCNLTQVRFVDCDLRQAQFAGALLNETHFVSVALEGANFARSRVSCGFVYEGRGDRNGHGRLLHAEELRERLLRLSAISERRRTDRNSKPYQLGAIVAQALRPFFTPDGNLKETTRLKDNLASGRPDGGFVRSQVAPNLHKLGILTETAPVTGKQAWRLTRPEVGTWLTAPDPEDPLLVDLLNRLHGGAGQEDRRAFADGLRSAGGR